MRLTAKADTAEAAGALLDEWDAEVRAIVGEHVFGVDDDTMESVVLDLLAARGWSLGLAESVTGGLVAGRITSVPGASKVFRGSIVSYASEVKFDLLGVPEGPVVSEAAAAAMAAGARRVLGADVALALTGVAGPTEQDGMPVGTLCVGIATPTWRVHPHAAPARPARPDAPDERDQRARPAPPAPARRVVGSPAARLRSSMERASGFYPAGWGFESLRGHRATAAGTAAVAIRAPRPYPLMAAGFRSHLVSRSREMQVNA